MSLFALMEKYVDIPELTTTIVNEFIKQIIVYAPEKVNGIRTQKVKIFFAFSSRRLSSRMDFSCSSLRHISQSS